MPRRRLVAETMPWVTARPTPRGNALPDLVRSYSGSEGPDVGRIRELTKACFAAASGEEDLQESLAEVTELVSKKGGAAESQPVPKTLVQ